MSWERGTKNPLGFSRCFRTRIIRKNSCYHPRFGPNEIKLPFLWVARDTNNLLLLCHLPSPCDLLPGDGAPGVGTPAPAGRLSPPTLRWSPGLAAAGRLPVVRWHKSLVSGLLRHALASPDGHGAAVAAPRSRVSGKTCLFPGDEQLPAVWELGTSTANPTSGAGKPFPAPSRRLEITAGLAGRRAGLVFAARGSPQPPRSGHTAKRVLSAGRGGGAACFGVGFPG